MTSVSRSRGSVSIAPEDDLEEVRAVKPGELTEGADRRVLAAGVDRPVSNLCRNRKCPSEDTIMGKVTTTTGFVPTPEQAEAIAYRKGNLQITACAGSGKTEAISRRVCSLIEEGVEPLQVIAFTFTERAAAGLQARIKKRIGESMGQGFLDRLGPMFVGTIHSYCLQMLQTHVPRYGNFDMLDENRLAGLLSREHKRIGIGKLGEQHWRPISEFLRNVDVVENELIDPARLKGTPFGEVFEAFSGMLERYRYLTFGLLISTAVRALEDPHVFQRVHGPLRHLIVNEYQDINPAQERLIELLAQPPVHLCVVGDDDQSIYQWRGSDVSNILDFEKRYKSHTGTIDGQPPVSAEDHRSGQQVCQDYCTTIKEADELTSVRRRTGNMLLVGRDCGGRGRTHRRHD